MDLALRSTKSTFRLSDTGSAKLVVGRADDADIQLQNQRISRKHAELERLESRRWRLVDQSANGTCVNGVRVKESLLSVGDTVLFECPRGIVLGAKFDDAASEFRFSVVQIESEAPTGKTKRKMCRYGGECRTKDCHCEHPDASETARAVRPRPCRYGASCYTNGCSYDHPDRTPVAPPTSVAAPSAAGTPCRYGNDCYTVGCRFRHPADVGGVAATSPPAAEAELELSSPHHHRRVRVPTPPAADAELELSSPHHHRRVRVRTPPPAVDAELELSSPGHHRRGGRAADSSSRSNVFRGLRFCFSGALSMVRREFSSLLTNHGAVVTTAVGPRTDFLVTTEFERTSKTGAAQAKGVAMVSEDFIHDSINAGRVVDHHKYALNPWA